MILGSLIYLETQLARYICQYPDNISVWLDYYTLIVESRITHENMAVNDVMEQDAEDATSVFELLLAVWPDNLDGCESEVFYRKGYTNE